MDFTLIADAGTHSVKYAGLAKRNRRKDWPDGQVRDLASPDSDPNSGAVASCVWREALSTLIAREVGKDEELTLVLLMDTFASRSLRENLFQFAFEHVGAKQVAMCYTAATSLFAAGSTSGVTVDVGYSGVRVTPVDRGIPIPAMATVLSEVGCAACDEAVRTCLLDKCPSSPMLSTSHFRNLVRDPMYTLSKSRLCGFLAQPPAPVEVQSNTGEQTQASGDTADDSFCTFPLPDGSSARLPCTADVRMKVTRPLLYSDAAGVHAPMSFANVYQKYCVAYPQLQAGSTGAQWTCVGGGATASGVGAEFAAGLTGALFGLPDRQMTQRNPTTAAVEGALILTHLSSFKGVCVSQAEYEEDGPSLCVHVKTVDAR